MYGVAGIVIPAKAGIQGGGVRFYERQDVVPSILTHKILTDCRVASLLAMTSFISSRMETE